MQLEIKKSFSLLYVERKKKKTVEKTIRNKINIYKFVKYKIIYL